MFQITFNIENNKDQGGGNTMDDNLSIIEEELEQLEVNTSGEKTLVLVMMLTVIVIQ